MHHQTTQKNSEGGRTLTWKDVYRAARSGYVFQGKLAGGGVEVLVDKVLSRNATYLRSDEMAQQLMRIQAINDADNALEGARVYLNKSNIVRNFSFRRWSERVTCVFELLPLGKTLESVFDWAAGHAPPAPEIYIPALISTIFGLAIGVIHSEISEVKYYFRKIGAIVDDTVNETVRKVHWQFGKAGFAGGSGWKGGGIYGSQSIARRKPG